MMKYYAYKHTVSGRWKSGPIVGLEAKLVHQYHHCLVLASILFMQ